MNFLEELSSKNIVLTPGSPAIEGKDFAISYQKLKEKIYSVSAFLSSQKISAGEPVAIFSDNNPDFIILTLALWLLDAVPVPLNTRLTDGEIHQLMGIAGCKKIFVHKDCKNDPESSQPERFYFPFESAAKALNSFPSKTNPDNTAVIIFTSGSSGIPKGVMLSFRNLLSSAEIGNSVLNQDQNDKWLASLPFYHIGGFSIITRAFLYGASIIIPGTLDTIDLKYAFENKSPTLASLVSTQLKRLIESGAKPGNELKNLLLGGGFIDDELVITAVKNGWKISKVYGSSETSSFVTMITVDDILNKINSAGKILSPNEISIIDESGNRLPAGRSGEIVVKSSAVMKGYINNTPESKNKLKNGRYHTGDIGYLDEDGYLFVEARRSDLIISGGENINPFEVQNAISSIPGIKESYVFGLEDKTWGHVVAAAVVKTEDAEIDLDLAEILKSKLAGYKIPKKIIYIERIPKTPLGKIEREKVRELFN